MIDAGTDQTIAAIEAWRPELEAIRHRIHANPETAFEEHATAALVAGRLREWGIEVAAEGIAKTGLVGTVRGRRPGNRAIALRADMDALHIAEQSDLPYRSQVPGKMHACGHDGHTTMLLAAARYLAGHADEFGGTVHLIFQPAEEGGGGGRVMIEEGLFERFPCDAVYGMHAIPGMDVGSFAIRPGPMLAASDSWTVTFRGTGGHGSAPHRGTDPTMPLGYFILGLQGIIGRSVSPIETAVLSIGHIAGGSAGSPNVIPSEIAVRGTARSYTPAVRDVLERRLGELATALAAAQGCTAETVYQRRYPPLVNHPEQTRVAVAAATATAGAAQVNDDTPPVTGAEDFAFMLEHRPGAYIMIGNGPGPYVHTPGYDFNDAIIPTGAAYWVNLARAELGGG